MTDSMTGIVQPLPQGGLKNVGNVDVGAVGVIMIRILTTNVCKTNFTPLVFHFQLPQLGRTQLRGFPHFPTFAFYSHNVVFSHPP